MLNLTSSDIPDFEIYEQEIGAEGNYIYVDPIRYERQLCEMTPLKDTAELAVSQQMAVMSDSYYQKTTPKRLLSTLLDFGEINRDDLKAYNSKTRSRELSSDAQKVIAPLVKKLQDLEAKGALTYAQTMSLKLLLEYQNLRGLASAVNNATAKMDLFDECEEVSYADTPLVTVGFRYERAETSRYYTKEDNIQGWNKHFTNSITVPKDYFLWWGDMSQIDLRVALNCLIKEDPMRAKGNPELQKSVTEFNKILESCTDKYEAFARLLHAELDRPFDLEKFKEERSKYKVGVLARIYGTGMATLTTSLGGDREFAELLDSYFKTNKRYQQFVSSVERLIQMNCNVVVKDYFGVERVIESAGQYHDMLLSQILNAPVQITSNSIVMLWVQKTIARFRELGFGPDKVRVYLVRHDEPVLLLHKDVLPYSWILEDHCTIALDDWDLLEMHSAVGTYYGEPDEFLTGLYNQYVDLNRGKLQSRAVFAPREKAYHPVSNVTEVYTYSCYPPVEFCAKMGIELPDDLVKGSPEATKFARRQILSACNGELEVSGMVRDACRDYKAYYGKCVFRLSTDKVWQCCSSFKELREWLAAHDSDVAIYRNRNRSGYDYSNERVLSQYRVTDTVTVLKYLKTFFTESGEMRETPDYSQGDLTDPSELESTSVKSRNYGGWKFNGSPRPKDAVKVDIDAGFDEDFMRYKYQSPGARVPRMRYDK